MLREKFERDYNVKADRLDFKPHRSGACEVAVVGDFAVYRDTPDTGYSVVLDGSVWGWREDLSAILDREKSMLRVKRIENLDGREHVTYLDRNGQFVYGIGSARVFDSYEDAAEYIEDEKCDPVYERSFMGECRFEIEEVI